MKFQAEHGIVHRDLKPQNIMFANEDIESLKIVDYGLAIQSKVNPVFGKCGSPGYISPEGLRGKLVSSYADVYSLGVIMYYM